MMTTILGRANRRPEQPTTRAIDPGSRPPGGADAKTAFQFR
jgi:hypothetical protein